jgi:glycosyltransferase involved in cell wall biosynthesis
MGLAVRGHHVRVACLMTGGGVADELQDAGIPVAWLEADRRGGTRAAWTLFKLLREPIDVLHAFLFHSNLMGRCVGTLARVPAVVVSERSVESTKATWHVWADRLTWRLADRWMANSRSVARVLEQREGIDSERIDTILNGIDLTYFTAPAGRAEFRSQMGYGDADRVVVCVGRLDPLKGQTTLLEAFRDITRHEPRARLCFVGDGAQRASLERQAVALELASLVRFAGTLKDVRPALAGADLFVLPSNEEGLPGSVIEAQAAGVPVVATAAGGTPELVQHERTGLLVPPRDPLALSVAVVRVLRDQALAQQLSNAAKVEVQHLSTDRMVETTLEMYRHLTSHGARARGRVAA